MWTHSQAAVLNFVEYKSCLFFSPKQIRMKSFKILGLLLLFTASLLANPITTMTKPTLEQVKDVMLAKGYKFFEQGDFNLNLIAIRMDDKFDNQFSDILIIPHKVHGEWVMPSFGFTTLAGTLGKGGAFNPLTAAETGSGVDGTAVILEGQYLQGLIYQKNGNRYPFIEYLKQNRKYKYLRDNDKDADVDRDSVKQEDIFFTHWHPMSPIIGGVPTKSKQVNYNGAAWSQGCMGSDADTWYNGILPIIRQAVKIWGNVFSPTILHAKDFEALA